MHFGARIPNTILVPLDGSRDAEDVLPFVSRLGRAVGARLLLLRVIPTVNPVVSHDSEAFALALGSEKATWRSAKASLSATAHSLRTDDAEAEVLLEAGEPEAVIVRTAQNRHADLIAMITHRRRGLERVFLGSVADPVIHQANVPILVVPHDAVPVQWTDRQPVDVLLALDGSEFAEAAVSAARGLAHALGGSLRLLRVSDHAGLASANVYLAKLAGTLEMSGPPVHRQVVVGPSVSAAILNEVRDNHIGALVMATHGRTGLLRAVLGSVAAETIALAEVPVLLVRPHQNRSVPQAGGFVRSR
jgi:nucleotide-binding universal stress UspA family protein